MAYLSFNNVSYEYPGGFCAVKGISLNIEKGENVAIVGQNGAGKTTTVKMCNRLFCPTKGDVIIGEMNTRQHTTAQVSRVVGYVFQNPDEQIFHSSIESEVMFGPKMMKLPEEIVQQRVNFALELAGLTNCRQENPYNLPLSVRKFITIAAIIAMDTEVMIFDEPTAGQDLKGNQRLEDILVKLQEKGKTIITITHDMEFVAKNFQRIIVMAQGKIITQGHPKEIFWNFEALQQAKLMQPYVSRVCKGLGINENIISMEEAIAAIKSRF